MKDLRQAALRGTLWSGVQQAGDKAIRLPVYLVLAHLLSPQAFGLVALAIVYIEFAQLFLNQGLTAAIVQRHALEREHLESAFWGNIVFAILLAAGSAAAAGPIAALLGQEALEPIIRWLSLGFLLSALSATQDALLRRELQFRALAVRSIGGMAAAGVAAIALAILGFGVWSLVALQLVYQAVEVVLLWRASDWRPRFRFSARHYRELFAFGVNMLGVHVLRFARIRVDQLLVGSLLGTTALGYYSMARTILNGVAGLVSGSIGPVLWSTFARLQAEGERLARAIYQAAEMLALVTWPAYVGIAAVAPEIVEAFLGEQWLPSIPVVQAFALAAVAHSVNGLNLTAITATGAVRWRVRLEVLVAVASVGAIVLAVPHGIAAVGWAFAGVLYLMQPVELWAATRLLPIRAAVYLRRLALPIAASLLMWGAVALVRPLLEERASDLVRLAALAGTGALVYCGTILAAGPAVMRRAIENLRLALRGARDPAGTDMEALA